MKLADYTAYRSWVVAFIGFFTLSLCHLSSAQTEEFDSNVGTMASFSVLPQSANNAAYVFNFAHSGSGSGSIANFGGEITMSTSGINVADYKATITRTDNADFGLDGMVIENSFGYGGATVVITGRKDGSDVTGADFSQMMPANFNAITIDLTSDSDFDSIDEFTIEFTGAAGTSWGFRSITLTAAPSDTSPPVVQSVSLTGSHNDNAASVTYDVTFDENANNITTGDFSVTTTSGSATGSVSSVSASSGTTVTVTVGSITGTGGIRLDVGGSSGIQDDSGNGNGTNGNVAAFTSGDTQTVDRDAPSVNSIAVNGSPAANATSISFDVTFSESVTNVDASDFSINGSGVTGSIGTVTGSGTSYNVPVTSVSGTGTITVDLNSSGTGIVDGASNAISAGFTSGATHSADTEAPSVTSISVNGSPAANATSISFDVTFSESVTNVDASDFSINGSGVTGSIGTVTGSGTSYNVPVTSVSGTGTITVDLKSSGTGIVDGASNAISAGFTSGATHSADTEAPSVTSISVNGSPAANATSISFDVTFSESVTNVDASDFSINGSGVTGSIGTVTGSGTSYNVPVTSVSGTGTITVDLKSSGTGIVDGASNAISAGFTSGATHSADTEAPTVTSIVRQSPTDATTGATSVTFRVTFSEDVTNVGTADFDISGAGAGGTASITGVSTQTANTVFDVTVSTINTAGELDLDFAGGQDITDDAGNAFAGAITTEEVYTIDVNDAPVISLTSTAESVLQSGTVTFNTANSSLISISDPDNNDQTVTITTTEGIFTLSQVTGLVFNNSTSNGSASLDFTGSITNINNALDGATFDPQGNRGDITIAISTDDGVGLSDGPDNITVTSFFDPTAGDIAFVGYNSDEDDGFAVVALTALDGTTDPIVINFTDNEWDGSSFNSGEGDMTWTITTSIAAGTVIRFTDVGGTEAADVGAVVVTGTMNLGNSDESIFAYVGTLTNPLDFITALSNDGDAGFTSLSGTGLTAGTNAIDFDGVDTDFDIGEYTGTRINNTSISDFLDDVTNTANWTTQDASGDQSGDTTDPDLPFSTTAFTVDSTVPTVTSIVRQTPTDATTNATSVTFRVTFSEDVNNVGTADFDISGAGAGGTASITGVSTQTANTVFDVTVSTINTDGELDLDFAGGQDITDDGGNAFAGTITTEEVYTIDQSVPTVTSIVRQTPTDATTNATSVTFRVTFSEDVNNVGTADFDISGAGAGGTASITGVSTQTANTVFDVTVSTINTDGELDLDFAGGQDITDDGGNAFAGTITTEEVYTIDQTVPTVTSIVRQTPTDATTNATSVTFRVTFSEDVNNVGTADFDISGAGAGGTASITGVSTQTANTVFDVTVSTINTGGELDLDFAGGQDITDDGGNAFAGTITTEEVYTIDQTVPTVTSIVRQTPTDATTNATSVTFRVTFSEDVNNVGTADFDISGAGAGGTASITGVSTQTANTVFDVTVSTINTDGELDLDFAGGQDITDDGGNAFAGTITTEEVYTIDQSVPTVTSIVRQTPTDATTNATSVTFRVTFSEDVNNVGTADFDISGAGAGGTASITGVSTQTANTVFDVTVSTINTDGELDLDFAGGQDITDVGGNAFAGTITTEEVYTIDQTVPTVTSIVRQTPTDATTNATSVTFRVTFSEDVNNVGTADFDISGAGAGGTASITGVSTQTANTVFDVTVSTINTDGELDLDFAGGQDITDDGGNAFAGTITTEEVYTIDQSVPTVTSIVRQTPTDATTNATSVTFRVTFSEDVNNVGTADFDISGAGAGGTASITGVSEETASTVFDVTVSTINTDGELDLDFAGGQDITDGGGNAFAGAITTEEVYTIDQSVPTVTSIVRQTPTDATTNATSVTFRVTFSEDVNNVGTADFDISGAGAGGTASITGVSTQTANTVFDVTVSTINTDGELDLDFAGGQDITDDGGNAFAGTITTEEVYTIDQTVPTVTSIVRQTPTDATTNATSVTFRVTFSEDVNNVGTADFDISGAGAGGTASITGVSTQTANTVFDVTVSTINTDGELDLDFAGGQDITDDGGNAFAGTITTEEVYTIDQTVPTVTSIVRQTPTDATTNAISVTFRVTFSEDVDNVGTADFDISGAGAGGTASITGVSTQTANTVFDVTVSTINTDGELDLDFAGGQDITDGGGNAFAGAITTEEVYTIDQSVPTVTSIVRQTPTDATTNATSVTFRVTFSEDVNNVGTADFDISGAGAGGTASITGVSTQTANTVFDVTVSTINTDGELDLDFAGGQDITDDGGNAFAGTITTEEVYTIDQTVPTVTSIVRQTPTDATTNATSVTFRVTFSEDVNNVGTADFDISGAGAGGTASITGVSTQTANTVFDVTVSTINTDGELDLDFAGGQDITDNGGNAFAGTITTEEVYTIDQTVPTVTSIVRQTPTDATTNATSVTFRVTFSEDVNNVGTADFDISGAGAGGTASITGVSEETASTVFDVTVSTINTNGELDLDFAGGQDITDDGGNAFAGTITIEEVYTIDQTTPTDPVLTSPASAINVNAGVQELSGTHDEDGVIVYAYADNNNDGVADGPVDIANSVGSGTVSGGNWSFNVGLVADSDNNFVILAGDAAFNLSGEVDVPTITEDSQNPADPVVTTPASAISVNAASQTISGTHTEDGVTVHAYADDNNDGVADNTTSLGSATVASNAWSFSVNLTADAANNFVVQAVDAAGNVSNDVDVPTITEDSNNPADPVVTTPASAISVNAASQTVSGTHTEDGVTVHAYADSNNDGVADNTTSLGSATVSSNAWSFSVNLTADAANNFVVQAADAAGNLSNDVDVPTVTEDSTNPADPVVTTPASAVTLNSPNQTIEGTHSENGVTVNVFADDNNDGVADNTSSLGSATVASNAWSISVSLNADAANNFVVQAVDGVGNVSNEVDVPTITEDSVDPASPVVTTPASAISVNTASQTISGTHSEDGITINLYADADDDGLIDNLTPLNSDVVSGGTWSFSATLTADAANNYVIRAEDAAGNISGEVDVPTITQDSQNPTDPVVTTPASAVFVNAATQTISGTHSEDGVVVHAYADADNDGNADNGTSLGNSFVSGGSWSFSVNLTADTEHNFVVQAVDDAGNVSGDVDVATITEDGTSPTISSTSPADNATDVSIESDITITFNEDIQFGSVGLIIFSDDDDGSSTLNIFPFSPGTDASISGKVLTISPPNPLDLGTNYSISFIAPPAIEDLTGNQFAGISDNTIFNFTTVSTTVAFDATSSNAAESTSSADLAVSLNAASASTVTVGYAVTGTATGTSGEDFTLADGTLTFNPGDVTKNITIASIVDDALDEADETVIVTLSNPTNAGLGTNTEHTYTINDNDPTPTVTLSQSNPTFAEASGTNTITATSSAASGRGNITVTIGIKSGGTATETDDFTLSSATITILEGATTGTATLTAVQDVLDEPNEDITIEIVGTTNADEDGTQEVSSSITDDDPTPTIEFATTSSSGAESTSSAKLTVNLSSSSGQDVMVDYTVTGTATGGGTDYTLADGTVTINAGSTSTDFNIAGIVADVLDEDDETVIVTFSNPQNATLGTNTVHTYTILDDDATPTISFTTASSNGAETVSSKDVQVDLSAVSGRTVTADYTVTGTATSGTDYTLADGTLTFTAGDDSETITIAGIVDDAILETNETVIVTLSNLVNAGAGTNQQFTYTIFDNDAAAVTIGDVTQAENGGDITVTATLDNAVQGGFTVEVNTADGTAKTSDSDYTAVSSQTLTFAGSASETKTFTVTPTADTKLEADETLTVSMTNLGATSVNVVITDDATVTISNDDNAAVTIEDVSGAENGGDLTFTATLDKAVQGGFSIDVVTADNTATTADNDYTALTPTSTTLTFNGTEGETKQFTVTPTADTKVEADETFTVSMSNLQGTSLAVNFSDGATGTITNDDAATVAIDDVTMSEGASGTTTYTFTATLTGDVDQSVSVDYSTQDGTATTADSDYTATNGTLTFDGINGETETFSVQVTGDSKVELDETFSAVLSNLQANGKAVTISDATGTGTITNDDAATLSINDVTRTENADGGATTNFTFTVTLDAAVDAAFTVDYGTGDNTATTAGSDYTATTGQLNFAGTANETQTITVTVANDDVVEADETFGVQIQNLQVSGRSVTIADADGVGTINNDDTATFTITETNGNNGSGNEDDGPITLTITVDKAVDIGYDVRVRSQGNTATEGTDYTALDETLTFTGTAGESKTFDIVPTADQVLEADETLDVGIFSTTLDGDIRDRNIDNQAQVTILNDDAASLAINNVTLAEGNSGTTAFTFDVTLTGAVDQQVTVDFTTADGTATTANSDYTAASGTLTFAGTDGEVETITVNVTGDTTEEPDEAFTATLSNVGDGGKGVTIAIAAGTGTITNEDDNTAPTGFTVTWDDEEINAAEAPAASFTFAGAEVGTIYNYSITSAGGGTPVTGTGTITVANQNVSAIDVSSLNDGALTLSVTLTDSFSNTSTAQTDQADLDTQGPTGTTVETVTTDTGTANDDEVTSDNTLSFAGLAEAGSTVEVFIDGNSIGTTTATNAGDWTFDHTGTTLADATYALTAKATDTFGNVGTLSSTLSVTVDTGIPGVSVTTAAGSLVNGSFTVTITYTEQVLNVAEGDVVVTNAGKSNFTPVVAGQSWTLDIAPTADGQVTIQVPAATANDNSGNDNTASNTLAVTFDGTAPTVTSIVRADPNPNINQEVDFTVIFSEGVNNVTATDFDFTNTGTISGPSVVSITPVSASEYTVKVDRGTGEGTYRLDLKDDDSITDDAGNALAGTGTGNGDFTSGEAYLTNRTPTDITILVDNIDENNELNDVITGFTSADADAGDTFTYSLVAGDGDDDNGSFAIIAGQELVALAVFNHEIKDSYNIRVQTEDNKGGTFPKAFVITINDVNEVGELIELSNSEIEEADDPVLVGVLTTLRDPDDGETWTYAVSAEAGGANNLLFTINGDELRTNAATNFEETTTLTVGVRSTDSGGNTIDEVFTITVTDKVIEDLRDFDKDEADARVKNFFTPNGDGQNDTWVVEDILDNPINEVKVYSQAGKLIFSQRNYENDWDGTFDGEPIPPGTYYYEINIYNGESIIRGFLTIIRN